MDGWIKLYRQIESHWIWNNSNYLRAWLWMILRANHKENKVLISNNLHIINRGEFITSISKMSEATNMSIQNVRTFLSLLESDSMINKESTSKLTKIYICNYDTYNSHQQTDENNLTNRQQTNNTQLTTDKKEKKDNNEKKRNILMRNSEITKEDIKESFLNSDDLKVADYIYYFNTALAWSDSKEAKRIDWIATVSNFARRDLKDGKMKLKPAKERVQIESAPTDFGIISPASMTYEEYKKNQK